MFNQWKVMKSDGGFAQQARAVESGKSLAFQGVLTDPLGNKINYGTDVRFRIYSAVKGGTALYDSGSCKVNPDKDGKFKVMIGSECGKKVGKEVFENNPSLYLGIKVGKDKEIASRRRIPNTVMSQDSTMLQGLPLGNTEGSIPFISSDGAIQLAYGTPVIESLQEDADLTIRSASEVKIASGKSSDVHLISGENGSIHFRTANSNFDNMLIAQDGNVSVGTGTPGLFKLEVGGSIGPSLDGIYDLGSSAKTWNNVYVNKICFTTVLDCIETGYEDLWVAKDGAISPSGSNEDLLIGNSATSSAQIKFSSTAGNSSFIRSGYFGVGTTDPISALHVEGALTLTGNVTDITTSNNENLTLAAHGTGTVVINDTVKLGSDSTGVTIDSNGVISDIDGSVVISDDVYLGSVSGGLKVTANGDISDADGAVTVNDDFSANGNLRGGLDTSTGTTVLDITGTGTAHALCHSSSDGTNDQTIVDCTSSPTADFAEMYPVENNTEYGEVMSLGSESITTTDGQSVRKLVKNTEAYGMRIIGIVSDNYGDFISVGHNIQERDNPMPIALKGRVPVKIDPSSESIKAGDYLTGSTVAGHATRAERPGTMIGRALEDWNPHSDKKTVMVFVDTAYADPTNIIDRLLQFASDVSHTVTDDLFVRGEIVSPVVRTDSLEANKVTSKYIYSPVVETETLKTRNITSADESGITIKGLGERPVATIEATGSFTTEGSISAKEASISGTLTAKEVSADNITKLKDRLEETVRKTDGIDRLSEDFNLIQDELARIGEQPLPLPEEPDPVLKTELTDPVLSEALHENLTVTGTASLFQLAVQSTISSLSDELRLTAASSINLLDGAAVLTRDGNLVLNGTLIARSGIKTNDIKPADESSDIRAHLRSSDTGNTSFTIQNQNGSTVAAIDASGSATFRRLDLEGTQNASDSAIIAAADNYLETGQYTPAINSNTAAAGSAILPQGEKEIIIYNSAIKDQSLIYLTPASAQLTSPISVIEKESCTEVPAIGKKPCKPYFKVGMSGENATQTVFNWLIIN